MTPEQTTQQRLDGRGVRDVKFLFSPEGRNAYASVVLSDVEEVLDKYLNGECRIVVDFSDKELPQVICA
jgi:hypothetical protein